MKCAPSKLIHFGRGIQPISDHNLDKLPDAERKANQGVADFMDAHEMAMFSRNDNARRQVREDIFNRNWASVTPGRATVRLAPVAPGEHPSFRGGDLDAGASSSWLNLWSRYCCKIRSLSVWAGQRIRIKRSRAARAAKSRVDPACVVASTDDDQALVPLGAVDLFQKRVHDLNAVIPIIIIKLLSIAKRVNFIDEEDCG